ncbi:MAG TPA: HlyD family efflux transporter periplasmic adaptor subunit [Burkholderiaceae bacterium]
MKSLRWATLVVSCGTALLGACTQPTDPGWSGYVEGDYVYVAAPLAGRLTTLAVQRGGDVLRGAPLFALDADVERAAREQAAAQVAVAQAQVANADKGKRRDELEVTQAQLAQAQAQAGLAASALARQQQLIAQGFISAANLDDARSAARQTREHVAELAAALRVAKLPARSDERKAAVANAQAAEQALAQAAWREQQKTQAAPAEAHVADTFFRVGEWVGAGQPVVALLPPGGTKARFFVPESELGTIKTGEPVTIRCDGCGAPIRARIDFIATDAEYTPPVIYSNTQRARLVFMVEAHPDPRDGLRLKPGQPVDMRRVAAGP